MTEKLIARRFHPTHPVSFANTSYRATVAPEHLFGRIGIAAVAAALIAGRSAELDRRPALPAPDPFERRR